MACFRRGEALALLSEFLEHSPWPAP
jgi:hypothetical protein